MQRSKFSRILPLVALVLVLALAVPAPARAAESETVTPQSTIYLSSVSGWLTPMGGGRVQVHFYIEAKSEMTSLGALNLYVYESEDQVNWTLKESHSSVTTPGLMGSGISYHSYITYWGIAARYYKAYICACARKGNTAETRYFWTPVIRAY